jgi:hypothetical protein
MAHLDYNEFREQFQDEGTNVTPNRLRGQINKLLQNTDLKIGEFQRMLGVNANSYGKFMTGKYKDQWSATQNGTYWAAAYFFYREKRLGAQSVSRTRAHGSVAAAVHVGSSPSAALSTPAGAGKKPALPDLSAVMTDGITYQTPAEVRKELQAYLQKHTGSVATLARAAEVPYQSFNNFMKAKGDFGGRDNMSYHPAAELVEKLRVATDKPKSKKRKALEAEMDAGIVDRRTGGPKLGLDPSKKYIVPAGMSLYMKKDSLGRNSIAH